MGKVCKLALESYSLDDNNLVTIKWSEAGSSEGVFKSNILTTKFDTPVTLNIDIAAFTFLNVIVPCYHGFLPHNIEVIFNEHVTPRLIQEISHYHNLERMEVVNPNNAKQSVAGAEVVPSNNNKYAIFYGGGKDSLLSAAIHGDLYGEKNVVLLRLVWDENPENLEKKREIIRDPLMFMSKKGFDFEYVESNFHCIIETRDIGKAPNIALYPGLMAPLLAKAKFMQLAHGYDAGEFHMPIKKNGKMPFNLVRPEVIKTLSSALSIACGSYAPFKNFNYGLHAGVAFKFLANSYPEYLPNIYMCERLAGKWCLKCRKCFFYALSCLAFKCDSDFNLGYFFQKSDYVKDLLKEISSKFNGDYSSIKYVDKFSAGTHLCSMVQVAHAIDLEYARKRLWNQRYPEAFINLINIIEPYKNFRFPDYDSFWLRAYQEDAEILGTDKDTASLAIIVKRLKESDITISDKYLFEGLNREAEVIYNYDHEKIINHG
jgi:hypothetical protein